MRFQLFFYFCGCFRYFGLCDSLKRRIEKFGNYSTSIANMNLLSVCWTRKMLPNWPFPSSSWTSSLPFVKFHLEKRNIIIFTGNNKGGVKLTSLGPFLVAWRSLNQLLKNEKKPSRWGKRGRKIWAAKRIAKGMPNGKAKGANAGGVRPRSFAFSWETSMDFSFSKIHCKPDRGDTIIDFTEV